MPVTMTLAAVCLWRSRTAVPGENRAAPHLEHETQLSFEPSQETISNCVIQSETARVALRGGALLQTRSPNRNCVLHSFLTLSTWTCKSSQK